FGAVLLFLLLLAPAAHRAHIALADLDPDFPNVARLDRMLAQKIQTAGERAMGVTAGRKGLRPDEDNFKAAAELIQQRVVITFALIKGLKKTRRPLKNLAACGKSSGSEQRGNDTALGREPDTESLGQRW